LNAGYNFDFIDDRAIQAVGVRYKVLILPHLERIPLVTLQLLQQYAAKGGRLIATRSLPSVAPGLLEAQQDTPRIQDLVHKLFEPNSVNARLVPEDSGLARALVQMVPPDFATGTPSPAIGFMHRKLAAADIYFMANLSSRPVHTDASVAVSAAHGEWWDPFTGEAQMADVKQVGDRAAVPLDLAPYESRLLVFIGNGEPSPTVLPARILRPSGNAPIDLSAGWTVTFPPPGRRLLIEHPRSWSDADETRFYSGSATYETTVTLTAAAAQSHDTVWVDFGPGTPVQSDANPNGMRALLESPVREAALVFVNGKAAGALWHPPFEIEVTPFVHEGENQLRLVVMNTAMNEMAQTSLPDYRLLNLRYGERFVPQDMTQVQPLPSGILGPVRLIFR
jgi:hypothetical protein